MKNIVQRAISITLGLIFLVFGLNGFFLLIEVPPFHPFMKIMVESGLIYFEKSIEVAVGLMLLFNYRILLATYLLGPVVAGIVLFHSFIDPRNAWMAWLCFGFYAVLLFCQRKDLKKLISREGSI